MLHVEGIEPGRIECHTDSTGRQRVLLDRCSVATLWGSGNAEFDGIVDLDKDREDAHAVMNAAIDAWRASGGKRLWPEPPAPEPVACICGSEPNAPSMIVVGCDGDRCFIRANTVAQWNIMQAALKAAKEKGS